MKKGMLSKRAHLIRNILAAGLAAALLFAGCGKTGAAGSGGTGNESASGMNDSTAGVTDGGEEDGTNDSAAGVTDGGGEDGTNDSAAGVTDGGGEDGTKDSAADGTGLSAVSQMDTVNASLTQKIPEGHARNSYEVFVYSFSDSDGDGIGDLQGLIDRLDYIGDGDPATTEDLDMAEIWLLPVFPSPTYHKYDAADYMSIDPAYGTMKDFERLLSECHKRNIRLIMDFALNHTSVEHPWFKEAVEYLKTLPADMEPDTAACPYAGYYHFSRNPSDGYAALNGADGWYYEARFWEGMPDLNLDNEMVRDEIRKIAEFWLSKGVDGFRLDAVTSYYTENRDSNISFLSWFNSCAKDISPDAYLVGECWTDLDTYVSYYRSGVDSFFDFAFSGADGVIASVVKGSRPASYYTDMLVEEEGKFAKTGRRSVVNAPFYTNHDMARSAGYYAYDDGSRTKLAGALNLFQTGNAFVYYGEELGMKGSGKDENKRAPMQWSSDPEADGMCDGPPEMESQDMKFGSYEEQQEDPLSIYSYYRHALHIRNSFPAIAKGRTHTVPEMTGESVCAFIRRASGEASVLIAVNTGEEAQTVTLSGDAEGYGRLAAVLTVSEEEVSLSEGSLTLPPFGAAVLVKG